MNYRRSAASMLISFILLGAASHDCKAVQLRADSMAPRGTADAKSVAISLHSPIASRGATLSPFTQWKSRIKIVLVETYERIIEESEFGLVIPPAQLFVASTSELVSCPLPIRPPLRC